ncbi:zinc ABC transporter substrate-binding protein ZnuA [Aeromonas diversa]|uniref:zinc ABC transporter substrate-binding protein ZnuA n=1 Tax=Aeromonas diversa TaxID=502790 RepID=UPI0039A3356C
MRRLFLTLLMLGTSLPTNAIEVLATLKPIAFIAAAITRDVAEPEVLLPTGASPHDFALRPSDLRRLKEADLVIWVGPELESFLVKPLADQQSVLTLLTLPGLPVHRYAEGEAHDHDEHDGHHHHGNLDPHIWLGPDLAGPIARAIAARLGALDPTNAARYQGNLVRFEQALAAKDAQVREKMKPVQQKGYFVFHDAYGYWERHYGMQSRGHFTVSPDRRPGAKTLVTIRRALEQHQARCVFAEPQFRPDVIESVVRNTGARVLLLDESGGSYPVGPDAYLNWMDGMANAFSACQ